MHAVLIVQQLSSGVQTTQPVPFAGAEGMEGGMLPAVNSLAGKVLMTCKCIDNSWSFREESRGKASLRIRRRCVSRVDPVHYRAIGAERFWARDCLYRFGSITDEEGWGRPGRPTQGPCGSWRKLTWAGSRSRSAHRHQGFGDHGPATRNSNNKIFSNLTSHGSAGAKEGMNETHCNRI